MSSDESQTLASLDRLTPEAMHDVNNALAIIATSAGYLTRLEHAQRDGAAYDEALIDILDGVHRAAEVCHRLLAVARGSEAHDEPTYGSLPPPSPRPGSPHPRLALRRVLFVEDEPSFRRGVARLLRHEGAYVEVAETGREAVELLSRPHAFDLLVLDSDLREGDGLSALRRLQQSGWRPVPVLGMSGPTSGKALLEAGAGSFLAKPFTREALLRACTSLLRT